MGDQILVCDGISMINVSHNEAAQALKRAMDMESVNGLSHSDVIEVSIIIRIHDTHSSYMPYTINYNPSWVS